MALKGCVALWLAGLLSIAAAAGAGVPVCPAGLQSCGTAGCYSSFLTTCRDGQCQSILPGLFQPANLMGQQDPSSKKCAVWYINACGENFCGTNEECKMDSCVLTGAPALNILYETGSQGTMQEVAVVANASSLAYETCLNARAASEACPDDTTELEPVQCNAIGVASVPGVSCWQSHLFNCAAGQGTFICTCRVIPIVTDTIQGMLNNTYNFTHSISTTKQQPLLMPLFQGLVNAVGSLSQKAFNLTLPSSPQSVNKQQQGFKLTPPDGISAAKTLEAPLALVMLALALTVPSHSW